jgi:hypothetical protein
MSFDIGVGSRGGVEFKLLAPAGRAGERLPFFFIRLGRGLASFSSLPGQALFLFFVSATLSFGPEANSITFS